MVESIESCLKKVNLTNEDIDFFLSGDLLNQNITTNYALEIIKSQLFVCLELVQPQWKLLLLVQLLSMVVLQIEF